MKECNKKQEMAAGKDRPITELDIRAAETKHHVA